MTKKSTEVQVIDLDKFSTSQLPELQNKKQELKKAIEEFPFVEITDNASYELAKKSRTGVKTIRTSLEKEKKLVIGKLKEKVLNVVSDEYDLLLSEEVVPVENTYQAEVTRYENEKEQERQEKLRIEQERIDEIKGKISNFENIWSEIFNSFEFEDIENQQKEFETQVLEYDYASLQEFEIEFKAKLAFLRTKFEDRVKVLAEKENIRLEQEKLAEERKDNERVRAIQDKIGFFYNTWYAKIHGATIKTIAQLQEDFSKLEPIDCQELQNDYEEKKSVLEDAMDAKFRVLKTAEDQRISQENFAKEKAQFEEEKKKSRSKELKSLGFELIDGDFKNTSINLVYSPLHLSYPQEQWNDLIAKVNTKIEEKNKSDKEIIEEVFPDCLPERPLTQEDAFEPDPNNIEVIENNSEIEQPNVIDEEQNQTSFNVLKMTFEEKQNALTDWILNREEYELDALIEQYLN